MRTVPEQHFDSSGGVQAATGWMLRATNELEDVINGRFDDEIGVSTRRNGYIQKGDTLQSGKRGLGLHEAKFSTGAKSLAAINNSGDTATVIKSLAGSTWTNLTLPGALPANTQVNFCDSLDDAYAAGIDSLGARMSIINIKNDLTTSITRNLIGAPKARFVCEYGGALFAMNVDIGGTVYRDRAYKSSPALSVITYTRGAQSTNSTNIMLVDTVRYLKAGMAIDIYNHLTDTVLYSNITIVSVDKAADTITLPARSGSLTFATTDVNTTTEVITLSSTTNYPTGTPIVFTSSGVVPGGLTADVVYYVINASGTTIKVASSLTNATAGTAIDLTTTGSGTHTIRLVYTVGDNDEIYLTGRHGELYYLWNTDYPSTDKADFLKMPSGAASNSEIVGYGKSNDRLFFYTSSTTHKWDQAKLTTLYEDIGCANHNTIRKIGDWLIWLDTETRVVARNDSTGQMEFISKAIKKKYLKDVISSNYPDCAAGRINNVYKLHLGTVNGDIIRVCYDFDANNWTRENHKRKYLQHMLSDMSGNLKMYFLDDTGKLYTDDTGDLDDTDTIPFMVRYGRNNSGSIMQKVYSGYYIIGQNLSGLKARVYLDGETNPTELDVKNINPMYAEIKIGSKEISGRDINLELSHNGKGSPVAIEGYVPFLAAEETNFG